jgi:hypothetical protein
MKCCEEIVTAQHIENAQVMPAALVKRHSGVRFGMNSA